MEKKEKKLNQQTILIISIILIIILLDQGFKIWVQRVQEVNVISGVLNFNISQNTNAAYGIGTNSTIMYVATNIVILGVIFKFMTTQNDLIDNKLRIFLSFILAGGISNVIDKIIRGYITEFIDFGQIVKFPIFNFADIFILIGWVAIAANFASFTVKEWRKKKGEESS